MYSRILPKEEWHRLPNVSCVAQNIGDANLQIAVVEDGDRIVAHAAIWQVAHLESVRVDPDYRKAGTIRSLLRTAMEAAKTGGQKWVWGCSVDPKMDRILSRLHGVKIDVTSYVVPLGD